MRQRERDDFDDLLEEVIEELPDHLRDLLEEVPLIVDDRPDRATMDEVGCRHPRDLCGLYTGIPLTDRSVTHSGVFPDRMAIFREGIVRAAGGGPCGPKALKRQIRITLLHEMGHHFGLEEHDLRKLGYA